MTRRPWILGLSCSHNAAACLLHGDEIVAAVQDERLLRVKRLGVNARFATQGVNYCLETGGIDASQLDLVVCCVTRGNTAGDDQDIFLNETLRLAHWGVRAVSVPHHYAHAVSAFASSGFRDAAVLVIDGSGTRYAHLPPEEQQAVLNPEPGPRDCEWMSYYEAEGTTLTPRLKQLVSGRECDSPSIDEFGSLGHMYAFVGARLFGHPFEGPGKVMGLAPYGEPSIPAELWLRVEESGLVRFTPADVMPLAARCSWPDDFRACADLAASVQKATEAALTKIVARLRALSTSNRLCYAGGVALNSVANEGLVRHGGFDDVFVFPAAEDSGVAVGAAYHGLWTLTRANRSVRLSRDAMGRSYGSEVVERALAATPAIEVDERSATPDDVAELLCEGRILGWFQGRSELGPRALGQRSILCDPRRPDAKDTLNARVKGREGFRPFAPVILKEHAEEWFDVPSRWADSPFMLRVWPFRAGLAERVPAVAHVDGTARVQTVERDAHPHLAAVLDAFHARTGVPILLNTSFNLAGEPIVETPEDALWCLLVSGLDGLVLEGRVVRKAPSFSSILDLRMRVVAVSLTREAPIREGGIGGRRDDAGLQELPPSAVLLPFHPDNLRRTRASLQRQGRITAALAHAAAPERWGPASVLLDEQHLTLLGLLDGTLDGHALLRLQPCWSEAWLRGALAGLYRAKLIDFARAAQL